MYAVLSEVDGERKLIGPFDTEQEAQAKADELESDEDDDEETDSEYTVMQLFKE
jgi:hypothetical protein